jgi:hypothetical protein
MRRSGGRCEFVLENGERCNSTWQVEVDHIEPKALGGPATVANTRACCKAHNQLAARRVFGDDWMDRFTRAGRKAAAPGPKRSVRMRWQDGNGRERLRRQDVTNDASAR